jgi:large repetitive protein
MKKGVIIGGIIVLVLIVSAIVFFVFQFIFSPPTLSNPTSIGITNDSNPQFSFTSSKAGTILFLGNCPSSSSTSAVKGINLVTFNSLSDGNYSNCQISVKSGDKESAPLIILPFVVDTQPPITIATSNYNNGQIAMNVTIIFNCSDSLSGCDGDTHYTINGNAEQRGNSVTFDTNGIYSLEYWNFDNAGNEESHHTEFNNIRIDLESTPSPVITTSDGYRNQSFEVDYNPTNSSDNCYYTTFIGGNPSLYGICSGNFSGITFSEDNNYTIYVYENDSIGNEGYSSPLNIDWDTTAPPITITFPTSGGIYNQTLWKNVSFSYSDAITCQYSTDNNSWVNFNSCADTSNYIPTSSASSQTLYVQGIDAAGNSEQQLVSFTYTTN